MDYQKIIYSVKGGIAEITLNDPEKRNALSLTMVEEIIHALTSANTDDDARVITITGAGDKAFCAGAQLADLVDAPYIEIAKFNRSYVKMVETFRKIKKPSIAVVKGFALAGGCGLAMYPTFAIATDTARFGLTEINVGAWSMMVSAILFATVYRRKALELLLTGEIISSQEAERIGMINKVAPLDELEGAVSDLAGKLMTKSGATIGLGLEAYHMAYDMEFEKATAYLSQMATMVFSTNDAREGLQAFVEKRKPKWSHRL